MKSAKPEPEYTQEPEALDDTMGIPFSLDKSIPVARVPEPVQVRYFGKKKFPHNPKEEN